MMLKKSDELKLPNFRKAMTESQDEHLEKTIAKTDIKLYKKCITDEIDIYQELGQEYEDDISTGKSKFRNKISQKMTIYKRKKVALASQILIKKKFYNNDVKPEKGLQSYTFTEDIYHYVTTCDFIKLIKALQKGPNILNTKDQNGNSLLYLAAQPGFYPVVRYLLLKGIDPNLQNDFGSTALHAASFYGHQKIVELLLLNGADYNIRNGKQGNVNTPLQESYNNQIKNIIKNHIQLAQNDPIQQKIKQLREKECLTLCNKVYTPDGQYIGIFGSIKYKNQEEEKLKKFLKNRSQYQQAYFGTKLEYAEKIINEGLQIPSKSKIIPQEVDLNKEVNGVKNWADAIFCSPSVYKACKNEHTDQICIDAADLDMSYSNIDKIQKDSYKFVFQIQIKEDEIKKYDENLKEYLGDEEDEPEDLIYRIVNDDDIVIQGFYFIREEILEKIKSKEDAQENFNEVSKMFGVMANQQNTLGQKIEFQQLCLLGHTLKKQKQKLECDICGQNECDYNYNCKKCDFNRCDNCVKYKIFL